MEVHRVLGGGLLESVYKEALEMEFRNHNILYEREKEFIINIKNTNYQKDFMQTL